MSVEDKEVAVVSTRDTTEEYAFDALAKGLASGSISRSRALKLVGTAILSGGLLAFFPGTAQAVGCPEGQRAINNRRCPRNACGGAGDRCFCAETVNGNKRCVDLSGEECPNRDQCDSNEQCPEGELCIKVGGCCGQGRRNLCARACSP